MAVAQQTKSAKSEEAVAEILNDVEEELQEISQKQDALLERLDNLDEKAQQG